METRDSGSLPESARQAFEKVEAFERHKIEVQERGLPALQRLADNALGYTHQPHHIRRILLATYNGEAWPLDLTRLRRLDADLIADALTVIEWSTYADAELFEYLPDGDRFMQQLATIEREP
ncbi:DUF7673 family protein [Modicisalibacter xianhensis]|uniref:DUF7673 domain-containing protein n=1 Tax=Modicisalibacter xianhensis TaxID=442341 RepID=A0A1I3FR84_9GAMM|nr:hypothetical protein [Halomonas xianhensis]SFI13743.1 hypothetical protein SAMN04487959_12055 [Halomonas xianhensis]